VNAAKMISIKGVLSFVGCFCLLSGMDKVKKQANKQKKYEARQKRYVDFMEKLGQFGIIGGNGKVCGFYQLIDWSSKYVQYMSDENPEKDKIKQALMLRRMQAKL
jgi:hypothetical protein